jgi:valyl-tRNA synthetase
MSLADKLNAVLHIPEAAMPAARDLKHMHKVVDVKPGRGAEQIDDEGLVWLG